MSTHRLLTFPLVVLALASAACAPATGGAGAPNASAGAELRDRGAAVASISGTTLDAKSGEPVSGAEVIGPGDVRARSDSKGRFVLAGLPVGATGAVEAHTSDGRKASVPLRALAEGRLEIVLHLR